MDIKTKIFKTIYPVLMRFSKSGKMGRVIKNESKKTPKQPFYELRGKGINGEDVKFEEFKGKKVLLVNTASECGYTRQFEELQRLHNEYAGRVVIIGFPANDFKEQEKGSDQAIAHFCQKNFGVSFPLMKKGVVRKTAEQQPVYQWLTNPALNGWNTHAPDWNFGKYLIDEQGVLTHYFGPAISPVNKEIVTLIK